MAKFHPFKSLTRKKLPKKVLILGSGALKIGEAGEFDYSGSQAIKAMKEERIRTVLINPNIATNQTSKGLADTVYFLPVDHVFVEKVIQKERPDGLLLGFGGQTALNCGLELERLGLLKKYKIQVLGTPVSAIEKTEDRELFKQELKKIDVKVAPSFSCTSIEEALKAAKKIGYPVIIRAAFALGGKGSGFALNEGDLKPLLESAFAFSPQVLVEKNLRGWKEIEYEVVRDAYDNCITVCNMENIDPMGIHTGESIVVAPSQTLSNHDYHRLREIAIKTIRHLGIVGECNIQYALDPHSDDYSVIEVNARLSRSSALASKATGYPLAHVAAKLALGYSLPELKNSITGTTTACFEPALDYLALKIPRWDLDKFRKVSREITTEMKSVGEIMALGRSFEEVIQKGLRMLQIGLHGFVANEGLDFKDKDIEGAIRVPTPRRMLAIAEALRQGWSTQKISALSGIDLWFLEKLANIVNVSKQIKKAPKLSRELLLIAKKSGFSDHQLGTLCEKTEMEMRALRMSLDIRPCVRQIDTLAAEYPAKTNYLYCTYHGEKDDVDFHSKKKKALVLGSGAYCIGSSVEFDWCCVNAIRACAKEGYETLMLNYNPETVSTDYDICDKLYFDELSLERVLDIVEKEKPKGVMISMGGQIPSNLAMKLYRAKVPVFGTSPIDIDRAESRDKFSKMLDTLHIDQPKWRAFADVQAAYEFADEVGYPVLVRPSYVLSGAAMRVAPNRETLEHYLVQAARISTEAPVVISKFELGAKEIEIDAVAHKGELVIWAIAEHIENAGVHSGDATIVLPPQKLYLETIKRIRQIAKDIAKNLNITGPFNIQFLAKNNAIKVIECNLRASRSFPFSSKVTGHNFIEIATRAMFGKVKKLEDRRKTYHTLDMDYVGVKVPQFSFSRLKGADPVLSVEMASTGEVACFGKDLHEAFLKAMISVGFRLPQKNILVSIGRIEDKADLLASLQSLHAQGFKIFATHGTSQFLNDNQIPNTKAYKIGEKESPGILEILSKRKVDFVINIPKNYSHEEASVGYHMRRCSIDLNIPLVTNVQIAKLVVECLERGTLNDLAIEPWGNYL